MIDGNALAGAFARLLGADVTTARLRCSGCGAIDVTALSDLSLTDMGAVVRCRPCGTVLLTVVDDGTRTWVGMPGASALGLERR